jgi:hypothetical protein
MRSSSRSIHPGPSPRLYWTAAAGLLLAHLVLAAASTRGQSLTYDEPNHLRYGEQILAGNSDRFDDSKMPFSALNAGVVRLARGFFPSLFQGTWQPERIGRLATILFSTLFASVILTWATAWYGRAAGLAALFLYALEPNILAHAGLITTDIYAAGMIALSILSFRWFLSHPTLPRAAGLGLVLGLGQLAKYTSVFVYPILLLLGAIDLSRGPVRFSLARLRAWAFLLAMFLFVNLLVVNAGFLFNRTLTPLGQYRFRSDLFRNLQSALPGLKSLPVPLPYPYLEGLDWVRQRDQSGEGYGSRYLFGEAREDRGFAGYYVFAYLLKAPLPEILALAAALIGFARGRQWDSFRQREAYLLVPAAFLSLYFNFLLEAQLGIRLFLVVFPFLIVFSSRLVGSPEALSPVQRGFLAAAALSMAVSVASYFPHFIPYFNELTWDRLSAHRRLADSNLDFGQAEGYLIRYVEQHPEGIVEPAGPQPGTLLVSVNHLTGVLGGPERYAWLRENFEPVGHMAYAYLIYEISPEELRAIAP